MCKHFLFTNIARIANVVQCLKCHKSLGLLLGGVLKICVVFVIVFVFVFVFVNFFGHAMSSHHFEQMSQRSQVSRVTL